MAQRLVLVRDSGHQALDELDATDIPVLAYDASGAASTAQTAAIAAAATDATTKANAAQAAAIAASQPLDSDLTAFAGLAIAADKLPYGTGSHTLGLADLTTAARTVLDDTTVGAMVDTLGGASATGTGGLVRTTSPVLVTPALGTPASGVATNLTGTAASLTAGTVTTNANLTGDVTSSGNATTLATVTVAKGGTGAVTALAARASLGAGSAAIRRYLPTGALYHTFDRTENAGNLALLATGRMSIVMIEMDEGVTITSISYLSATTALTVGVNQWFALFDSARAKLRVTGDDTSTAWASNSVKTLNLATTYVTTYSGIYFLGIMCKATTMPSLVCATPHANMAAVVVPFHGGNSTTGLTDPASCPSTAGTISGGVGFPYAYVS